MGRTRDGGNKKYSKEEMRSRKMRPDLLILAKDKEGKDRATLMEWKVPGEARKKDVLTGEGEAMDKYAPLVALLENSGYETNLVLAQMGTLGYVPITLKDDLQGLGLSREEAKAVGQKLHKTVTKDLIKLLVIRRMRMDEVEKARGGAEGGRGGGGRGGSGGRGRRGGGRGR